jgi:hypothetical protein
MSIKPRGGNTAALSAHNGTVATPRDRSQKCTTNYVTIGRPWLPVPSKTQQRWSILEQGAGSNFMVATQETLQGVHMALNHSACVH